MTKERLNDPGYMGTIFLSTYDFTFRFGSVVFGLFEPNSFWCLPQVDVNDSRFKELSTHTNYLTAIQVPTRELLVAPTRIQNRWNIFR